jgi:pyocin large subunit-like protein
MGFENEPKRIEHFRRHGADFAARSAARYEAMADRFLTMPISRTTLECRRPSLDVLRFDTTTDAYGVLSPDRRIRSFYVPVPCSSLPPGVPRVKCHGYSTNRDYFERECLRIW